MFLDVNKWSWIPLSCLCHVTQLFSCFFVWVFLLSCLIHGLLWCGGHTEQNFLFCSFAVEMIQMVMCFVYCLLMDVFWYLTKLGPIFIDHWLLGILTAVNKLIKKNLFLMESQPVQIFSEYSHLLPNSSCQWAWVCLSGPTSAGLPTTGKGQTNKGPWKFTHSPLSALWLVD